MSKAVPAEIINQAVLTIKKGKILICLTDTVYGFLADASNKNAVFKIYKLKKRPKSKPLPLFVKNLKSAKEIAFINKDQEKILKKYWPGKYTFVLKRKPNKKLYLMSKDTLALRVPNTKFLKKLLKKINRPLVQTSANISGKKVLTNMADIQKEFGSKKEVGLIVNGGNLKNSKSSKIIDITSKTQKIIRK